MTKQRTDSSTNATHSNAPTPPQRDGEPVKAGASEAEKPLETPDEGDEARDEARDEAHDEAHDEARGDDTRGEDARGEDARGEDGEDDEDDETDSEDDEDGDTSSAKAATPPISWRQLAISTLLFVASVALLDTLVNLRYPLDEPALWYLIPSTDVAVILLNFAIMGFLGTEVPRWLRGVVLVWLLLVRCLRLGDGFKGRYFAQRFNAYSDLPQILDGVGFLHSTWPLWQLVLAGVAALAGLVGVIWLADRALGVVQRYLMDRRQTLVAAALVGVTYLVVSSVPHNRRYDPFYARGFAASAMPRFQEEVSFFWNVRGQKSEYAQLIASTQQMLDDIPHDLATLKGANVYLILVESYGRAVFEWPPLTQATAGALRRFDERVSRSGFSLATGLLDSTTYGGQSWLAHSTLNTGIPTHGQLEFEIVSAKKPKPIASFFRQAGYRTVLAQPNTTRDFKGGDIYGFEARYLNRDFEYRGPDFAWAKMPDQYVLDLIFRREIAASKRPLFIEYVLISSHAPWSKLPTLVDWDKLGDGSVFKTTRMLKFPIVWPNFEHATDAYAQSIVYDFDVLGEYLTRYVTDGSLVIILGDHQPVAEVNGDSWEMGVPIHVLSRNAELVRPFTARGYEPGIRPNLGAFPRNLATFLPDLLVTYSTERAVPKE